MTQRAIVKRRLGKEKVQVAIQGASPCGGSCAGCSGCAAQAARTTAVARDPYGTQVGQRVTVETAANRVLALSAILYLLPFGGLLAAYLLLRAAPEGVAALGAVGAFLGGMVGVSIPLDRYLRRRLAVTCRVVAVGE